MVGVVLIVPELIHHINPLSSVVCRKVLPHARFQRPVKSLDDGTLDLHVLGRKIADVVIFQQLLHLPVDELGTLVRPDLLRCDLLKYLNRNEHLDNKCPAFRSQCYHYFRKNSSPLEILRFYKTKSFTLKFRWQKVFRQKSCTFMIYINTKGGGNIQNHKRTL